MLERSAVFKKLRKHKTSGGTVIKLFFDFYVLTLLNDFCGVGGTIFNNFSKANRITETTEILVDKFYLIIRDALNASVYSEVRYLFGRRKGSLDCFSAGIFHRATYSFYSKYKICYWRPIYKFDLETIRLGFGAEYVWESGYGGKSWVPAVDALLQNPKSLKDKILWIDHVLDLEHNNGFILNKTEFKSLKVPIKKLKKNAFNFRAAAKFKDLVAESSHKVQKLAIANYNRIPKQLL